MSEDQATTPTDAPRDPSAVAIDALTRAYVDHPDPMSNSRALLGVAVAEWAQQRLQSFEWSLGNEGLRDVIANSLHYGRLERRRRPGDASAPTATSASERRSPPLLDRVRLDRPGAPSAWFLRALQNACLDEVRKRRAPRPPPDGEQMGPGPVGVSGQWDPRWIPVDVRRTLDDGVRIVAFALRHAHTLPANHPLRRAHSAKPSLEAQVRMWHIYGGHLARDIALAEVRLRWDPEVAASDNHARAWQARYYTDDGHLEYTSPGEIPNDGNSSYVQHLRRFRLAYRNARVATGLIVRERRQFPDPTVASARAAIPSEWEACEHESLELPGGQP